MSMTDWLIVLWIAVGIQIALPFIIVWWARKDYTPPPISERELARRIYDRRK